jgi:hypothetical protein
MLNAPRIVVLFNRLKEQPDLDMLPRTSFFAGKAAPRTTAPSSSTISPAQSTDILPSAGG